MNRLQFSLAKLTGNEGALADLSRDVLPELDGKRIALVGNARSLTETTFGSAIDRADIVIRLNRAPMPDTRSHGARTDWLALSTTIRRQDLSRLAPRRLLWMTSRRKRLSFAMAQHPGFYLHQEATTSLLGQELGSRPSTGCMTLALLLRSDCANIALYGFDFFDSQSLSGRRTSADVPHDFDAERAWTHARVEKDPRLTLN